MDTKMQIKPNEFMGRTFLSKLSNEIPNLKDVKAYRQVLDGETTNLIITRSELEGKNVYTWMYTKEPQEELSFLKSEILQDLRQVQKTIDGTANVIHTVLTQTTTRVIFEDISYAEDLKLHENVERIIHKMRSQTEPIKSIFEKSLNADILNILKEQEQEQRN